MISFLCGCQIRFATTCNKPIAIDKFAAVDKRQIELALPFCFATSAIDKDVFTNQMPRHSFLQCKTSLPKYMTVQMSRLCKHANVIYLLFPQ